MGDHGVRPGVALALGALVRTAPEPGRAAPTLDDLTARLAHVTGSRDDWREAVAYLAAQVHAAHRTGDAARGRDAQFALSQIETQLAWFRTNHPATT